MAFQCNGFFVTKRTIGSMMMGGVAMMVAAMAVLVCAIATMLVRYVIDARAVNEVEGIELDEAVAAIQADHPEVELEEAVGMAADQAEAMVEADAARGESDAR